jgi:TRAP-type C4-dicarboxylate transport system permease small subunit
MNFAVKILRGMVLAMAAVAGASLFTMMAVTCADITLRKTGYPLIGAYDIVKMAAGLAIACGLPYTTAVKGHVAVEFFFHRLGRRGRIVVDTMARVIIMALFSLLTWQFILYGAGLSKSGQVSTTMELPIFWVPYVMAFSCAVVVLVTFYHLVQPGKALLNP